MVLREKWILRERLTAMIVSDIQVSVMSVREKRYNPLYYTLLGESNVKNYLSAVSTSIALGLTVRKKFWKTPRSYSDERKNMNPTINEK